MIGEEKLIADYAKWRFSSILSTTWLLTASLSIKSLEEEEKVIIEEMSADEEIG